MLLRGQSYTGCKDKCGENEDKAELNWIIPLSLSDDLYLYSSLTGEKVGGKTGSLSALLHALLKMLFGCSWNLLCWNILKSIRERSIDRLATPNWLCSAHRTEIIILILYPAAVSQHSRKKAIPQWTNWGWNLYCCQTEQTSKSRKAWSVQ